MSAETELHDAICNAVILLNNGEEIAPKVSAILRTALAEYNPAPPVVDHPALQVPCKHCGAVGMCPRPYACIVAANTVATPPPQSSALGKGEW